MLDSLASASQKSRRSAKRHSPCIYLCDGYYNIRGKQHGHSGFQSDTLARIKQVILESNRTYDSDHHLLCRPRKRLAYLTRHPASLPRSIRGFTSANRCSFSAFHANAMRSGVEHNSLLLYCKP